MAFEELDSRSSGALPLAAWFGLLAGFGEVCILGIQKFAFHQSVYLGAHVIWMAPLANICLFALAGLSLELLARRWPGLGSRRTIVSVFAFIAFLSWMLMIPRLQEHAALLLAAGFALQTGRFAAKRAALLKPFVIRAAQLMATLLIAAAIAASEWRRFAESNSLATLPAISGGSPNVLLIVLDTVRAESLSLYGYARPTTPRLEQFAKTGVRFEHALSTAPWTAPSHASLFTGRFPHELSSDWDAPLDAAHPTLAGSLRASGYATAGFVANTINCHYETGLGRGFAHYEDYTATLEEFFISSSLLRAVIHGDPLRRILGRHEIIARKDAAAINRAFLAWLPQQGDRPFFAFLNYFDAHDPYLPPAPYDRRFGEPMSKQGRVTHRLRMAWRSDREKISP